MPDSGERRRIGDASLWQAITSLQGEIASIKDDVSAKHKQNRDSVHELKNDLQEIKLEQGIIAVNVEKLVGNGQPGIIAKLSDAIEDLRGEVSEMRGARKLMAWLVPIAVTLLIGVVGILISMWATRTSRSSLGSIAPQTYASSQTAGSPHWK
jgi:hypothetical protein